MGQAALLIFALLGLFQAASGQTVCSSLTKSKTCGKKSECVWEKGKCLDGVNPKELDRRVTALEEVQDDTIPERVNNLELIVLQQAATQGELVKKLDALALAFDQMSNENLVLEERVGELNSTVVSLENENLELTDQLSELTEFSTGLELTNEKLLEDNQRISDTLDRITEQVNTTATALQKGGGGAQLSDLYKIVLGILDSQPTADPSQMPSAMPTTFGPTHVPTTQMPTGPPTSNPTLSMPPTTHPTHSFSVGTADIYARGYSFGMVVTYVEADDAIVIRPTAPVNIYSSNLGQFRESDRFQANMVAVGADCRVSVNDVAFELTENESIHADTFLSDPFVVIRVENWDSGNEGDPLLVTISDIVVSVSLSRTPTSAPTTETYCPTAAPTRTPSMQPTMSPTTSEPSTSPSLSPSYAPSDSPTVAPTVSPTIHEAIESQEFKALVVRVENLESGVYSKADADGRFSAAGSCYTKGESDGKYTPVGTAYSKGESDGRFTPVGTAYTKGESDGRFTPVGTAYTKGESDGKYTPVGTAYTKAESDGKYTPVGTAYTKGESDGRFTPVGTAYTKSEITASFYTRATSDGRFAYKSHTHDDRYYTEAESNARFAVASHVHDDRYYTEAESDARFRTGDTPCHGSVNTNTVYTGFSSVLGRTIQTYCMPGNNLGDGYSKPWTMVWRHNYYATFASTIPTAAEIAKYAFFSDQYIPCTSKTVSCNLPNKKTAYGKPVRQMTIGYAHGTMIYAYMASPSAYLDVKGDYRAAWLVDDVKLVDKCTSSNGIPPEPVNGVASGPITGLTFDKANEGKYTSNWDTDQYQTGDRRGSLWPNCGGPTGDKRNYVVEIWLQTE